MLGLGANTWWVLSGCTLLGMSSGILGSFAMLRRRSLLGDALAHAALPGICVAFLLTATRSLPILLVGALASSLLGAYIIHAIVQHSRIKEDAALGIVLSVFFAFGAVLLTRIQQTGLGNQAGLDKYLFGQAAAMVGTDVVVMAVCAGMVCLVALLLFKELKVFCFDSEFGHGMGFSPTILDLLLMLLIVIAVTIGLQAVGVVLMAALLITPAAAARYWTERLHVMTLLAAVIGGASGVVGTWLSTTTERMPTGPLIVLAATFLFVLSLVFAPNRGVLFRGLRYLRLRKVVAREHALRDIYEIVEEAGDWGRVIRPHQAAGDALLLGQRLHERQLDALRKEGLVEREADGYRLTARGRQQAYDVTRRHRLWEMFLMHEQRFGHFRAHRGADAIEHFLPPQAVEELEGLLREHDLEPALAPPPDVPVSGRSATT